VGNIRHEKVAMKLAGKRSTGALGDLGYCSDERGGAWRKAPSKAAPGRSGNFLAQISNAADHPGWCRRGFEFQASARIYVNSVARSSAERDPAVESSPISATIALSAPRAHPYTSTTR
jgi:hypothetical protein